jgi:hypothetical protein
MAFEEFRIVFPRSDFLALPLSVPIVDVRSLPNDAVSVEWETFITLADRLAVQSEIANLSQVGTTSEPFTVVNDGPIFAPNNTPVIVVQVTTPPLDAGTYQLSWVSMIRLTVAAANTAARSIINVNGIPQRHHWGEIVESAHNGSIPIKRLVGQTLTASLSIAKVGPGLVNAEMTGARLSIDKIG